GVNEAAVNNTTDSISDTYDGWYVLAALSHDFSDSLNFALTGSYHDFDDQAEMWQIGATVQYEVVENLLVSVAGKYEDFDYDNNALGQGLNDGVEDNWQAKLRVQRNF
ncbi:MAG: porin, partial [Hyphomicrobiales bacterium]